MDLTQFLDEYSDLDKCCMDIIDDNQNMMIPWYIMAAYAYYVEDNPIISDQLFDKLAQRIYNKWEELDHIHKDFLDQDMVRSDTYLGDYPSRVKGAVEQVREIHGKKTK